MLLGIILGVYSQVYELFTMDPANYRHGPKDLGWHAGHILLFVWFCGSFGPVCFNPAERRVLIRDWSVACAIIVAIGFGLVLYSRSIFRT